MGTNLDAWVGDRWRWCPHIMPLRCWALQSLGIEILTGSIDLTIRQVMEGYKRGGCLLQPEDLAPCPNPSALQFVLSRKG